ncbi:MAG: glycosyltransferase, partial [Oscillospiraceae bacterium]|nr:glycosyltransferase [Oscillospiraceae bacterium]
VMWIHNNVEIKLENEWKYRVLWHFFKDKLHRFDGFVPCSPALEEPFRRLSGCEDAEYRVIANYIDVSEIRRKQAEVPAVLPADGNAVNFVALGRLCHQKGYDIMIPLFAGCCRERDDLALYIIGDGPDREALAQLAEREAPGKIHLLGQRMNPYAIMERMDAFLSTSRYEGQPLNIEEAKAIGLPVYCTKNLEQYTEAVHGLEEGELRQAILAAEKQPKQPDDLKDYNRRVLESIYALAEE